MRKYIAIFVITFAIGYFLNSPQIYSSEKVEHECTKCHQITNEEVLKVLTEAGFPEAKVIEVRSGPLKGIWEIAFEAESRKNIGYLDFSKQKIIIGNIINLKTRTNLTGERFYELNKIDVSQIPLGDALVAGDKNARYKVIVFTDPD